MTDTGYLPPAEGSAGGEMAGGDQASPGVTGAAGPEPVDDPAPVDEAGPDEAGPDEAEPDEAEPDEAEPDETEPDETEPVSADDRADTDELFQQSEIAADYIEGLLDVLDMDGDIDELVAHGRPMVEVVGGNLQALIGQRGATLEALQELARLAIYRQTGLPSRLLLDIGGYRASRRDELAAVARNAVERVREFGQPVKLDPMSAFERKCVHDVINATDGVASESHGLEPNRRVVVRPV